MLEDEDYASDTDDDDYRPSDGEAVSEEEGSGEEEDVSGLKKEPGNDGGNKAKKKNKRKYNDNNLPRKRRGGIQLADDEEAACDVGAGQDDFNTQLAQDIQQEKQDKKQHNDKKKADDLWASFLSDIPSSAKPKPKPVGTGLAGLGEVVKSSASSVQRACKPAACSPTVCSPAATARQPAKVTITKEYDFAGETVKVTKEVAADSKEAKEELKKQEVDTSKTSAPLIPGLKRPAACGGLGSVLGKIGKKSSISTLDKSKLDWESFKQKEGISEELSIHNRGKEGYVERQKFLERADVRQFELERDLRLKTSKR